MFTGIRAHVIISQCSGFEVEEHEWVANAALKLVIKRLERKIKYCSDGSRCDKCIFKQNLITNNLKPLFLPQTIYLKKCKECRLKYKLCSECKDKEKVDWCSNCKMITRCEKNNSWCSECKKLDITYGFFVKIADYMQTPIDLFSDDTDFNQLKLKENANGGKEVSYLVFVRKSLSIMAAVCYVGFIVEKTLVFSR